MAARVRKLVRGADDEAVKGVAVHLRRDLGHVAALALEFDLLRREDDKLHLAGEDLAQGGAVTSPKRPWMTLRLKSEVVCIMRLVSPSSTGSQSENQVL